MAWVLRIIHKQQMSIIKKPGGNMANKYFLCKTFDKIEFAIDFSYGKFFMRSPAYYSNLELDQTGRYDLTDGQGFRFTDVQKMFKETVGCYKGVNKDELSSLELIAAPLDKDENPILEECINITPYKPVMSRYDDINRRLRIFCLSIVTFDSDTGSLIKLNDRIYEFGEYTVFINNIPEFFRKMDNSIMSSSYFIRGCRGPVKYYDYKNYDGYISPFMKDKTFKFQFEFRYCFKIKSEVDESINVSIGNIEDIVTICKTSKFINITNITDINQ